MSSSNYDYQQTGVSVRFTAMIYILMRPQETSTTSEPPVPPDDDEPNIPAYNPSGPVGNQIFLTQLTSSLFIRNNRNVKFEEEAVISNMDDDPVQVTGYVDIRNTVGRHNPRVMVEATSNYEDLKIELSRGRYGTKIEVPMRHRSRHNQTPWIKIKAHIVIRKDTEIDKFSVKMISLHVLVPADVSFEVDRTDLSSVNGDVISAYGPQVDDAAQEAEDFRYVPMESTYQFSSRIITAATTHGTIGGNWPLLQDIELRTSEGNIKAIITPKPSLERNPIPARLTLRSCSGTIRIAEPIDGELHIPARDYIVDASTTTGHIYGSFIFGQRMNLNTTEGDIIVNVLPVVRDGERGWASRAALDTTTVDGETLANVQEPLCLNDRQDSPRARRALVHLNSTHNSTSGPITMRYPQSWQGQITARSTGDVAIAGLRLNVSYNVGGIVVAHRERRHSTSIVHAISHSGHVWGFMGHQIPEPTLLEPPVM